jgi:hypothetical protein
MRPLRRYYIEFTHPTYPKAVRLFTLGRTPCLAKAKGFELLELLKKTDPDPGEPALPLDNRWRLARQEDRGIAE